MRDPRLYRNSDKQPKKGDIIRSGSTQLEVKGVSKCGYKLYIKGMPMTEYCNTGCWYLVPYDTVDLDTEYPEWFYKKFGE